MSGNNSSGETEDKPPKDASVADSSERESVNEVPQYEGQWVALSNGESGEFDGDSDTSGDSGTDDTADE